MPTFGRKFFGGATIVEGVAIISSNENGLEADACSSSLDGLH